MLVICPFHGLSFLIDAYAALRHWAIIEFTRNTL